MMELNGKRNKVDCERPIHVSSEDVKKALLSRAIEARIPVLRLELDYELMSLHDAIVSGNAVERERVKSRLQDLRQEMLMYEMFSQKHAGGTVQK
ncbi:hypothetical protein [Tumebacillus lipolyticus]|uniref:Uncharacterized protein n=1 Tax=Tumebacillus lipolyticus TaxID=1280370 RepID=A0ABW4ZVL5_9BACL